MGGDDFRDGRRCERVGGGCRFRVFVCAPQRDGCSLAGGGLLHGLRARRGRRAGGSCDGTCGRAWRVRRGQTRDGAVSGARRFCGVAHGEAEDARRLRAVAASRRARRRGESPDGRGGRVRASGPHGLRHPVKRGRIRAFRGRAVCRGHMRTAGTEQKGRPQPHRSLFDGGAPCHPECGTRTPEQVGVSGG